MGDSGTGSGSRSTVAYVNSYKLLDRSARATGLRTNELRYRSLSNGNDPRVAEDFLINSRLRRGDWETESSIAAYFRDDVIQTLAARAPQRAATGDHVALPPPVSLRIELGEVLAHRRSVRLFTGDVLPFEFLATLLRAAAGITGTAQAQLAQGGEATLHFRTAPSAGGLYPIDVYVLALRVASLPRNVFKFDPFASQLAWVGGEGEVEAILRGFPVSDAQISLSRANVVLLLVGRPWRAMRKYGPRGMRFVFMEAGSMAQNIALAATALGFGSVDCASTYDDEIHEALELDGVYQALIHCVVVGHPG